MADRSQAEKNEVAMDMTPMIDCIFQLIIFFFLIIDLQNQELEPLVLPTVTYAVQDELSEGFRPVINIRQDGTMIYKLEEYRSPEDPEDDPRLKRLIKDFSTKMKKERDSETGKYLPSEALLIRADKHTEMHHVAEIMKHCGDEEIQIWKVELAVGEIKDNQVREPN